MGRSHVRGEPNEIELVFCVLTEIISPPTFAGFHVYFYVLTVIAAGYAPRAVQFHPQWGSIRYHLAPRTY